MTEEQHRRQFWVDYRATDDALRQRCAALIAPPPTDAEWRDANLLEMDGVDASDDELESFWRAHRVSEDRGYDELPDLRFVKDTLAAGRDPADEWVSNFEGD